MGDAAGAAGAEGDELSAFAARIRACAPDLTIASLRLNPDGLTNHVLIVDDAWVFRFPKDDYARDLLAREMQTLAVVRSHVHLAVPDFTPCGGDGVRYRLLAGRPLYRHDLLRQDEATQARIAGQLGHFLRQLHAIPPAAVSHLERDASVADPQARWQRRYEEIKAELYPYLWTDQRDWIEQLFQPVLDGSLRFDGIEPVLIHNDLASYHLLCDAHNWSLTGVIDFGVARLGDPADDLGILISTYGESFVRRVAAAYPLDAATLNRARFRAGEIDLQWALAGVRSKDPSWFLVHIGRARDVGPYSDR